MIIHYAKGNGFVGWTIHHGGDFVAYDVERSEVGNTPQATAQIAEGLAKAFRVASGYLVENGIKEGIIDLRLHSVRIKGWFDTGKCDKKYVEPFNNLMYAFDKLPILVQANLIANNMSNIAFRYLNEESYKKCNEGGITTAVASGLSFIEGIEEE